MSLKTQIDADIKAAMLARDQGKLLALRDIKKLILIEETKPGATELTEADEMKILQKAVKQRKDSVEIYKTQGRQDLLDKELAEIAVIEVYLPAAMSEEELQSQIAAIIEQVGAKAPSDMGKVMGVASKQLAGKAEGRAISEMVKKLLAQ
ncbi:MAG: GatB/YqeY domain-containing protein [Cytophagaceae bacterium]|nr:GatB/YqeY domain-containing protein [Cytophagaceae bacterium]MBK9509708.1 GatB/YqeY domain-containing protein [Cytophagaceae bacterium]MBK9933210.1 GatB/YqeY domain-containing protein [Cytophagaceae bacterium]MBL0303073.1 GatB/YqeY domain-containing protein [Cytophagaceae bacterium]MBL0325917.1 GatB/YqeY domain-containing protein [Cytophagaceae bacterium]